MITSLKRLHSSSLRAEALASTSPDVFLALRLSSVVSRFTALESFSLSVSVLMLSWECLGGVRLVWDGMVVLSQWSDAMFQCLTRWSMNKAAAAGSFKSIECGRQDQRERSDAPKYFQSRFSLHVAPK